MWKGAVLWGTWALVALLPTDWTSEQSRPKGSRWADALVGRAVLVGAAAHVLLHGPGQVVTAGVLVPECARSREKRPDRQEL